jgi:hypothetical protein
MAVWSAWYANTLLNGMRWFSMTAPGAGGFATRVVRFRTNSLRKEYIGNGVYRVSARLQQRGVSDLPQEVVVASCVYENFSAGLTPYTLLSGSLGLFTIGSSAYGATLDYAGTTSSTVSAIRRALTSTLLASLSVKFMVQSASADDGAMLVVQNSAGGVLCAAGTRREGYYDGAQRISLTVGGENVYVGTVAATLNVWHQLDIAFAAGAGNTTYTVQRLDTLAVLGSGVFSADHALATAGFLKFNDDAAVGSAPTRFADIAICP